MEHERRLTEVEERSKANHDRLDKLEERQNNLDELVGTVKVLAVREENVESTVKKIEKKVDNLADKPGKRWESLVSQIITILVAAVIGFALAKIGL